MDALLGLMGALFGAAAVLVAQLCIHRQNLQLTAADRRLQAQQEAFTLWWKLATNMRDNEKRIAAISECESFWNSHCLYLGRKSRKLLRDTMIDVSMFDFYADDLPKRQEVLRKIQSVFHAIMADAALPELTESFLDIQKIIVREEKKT